MKIDLKELKNPKECYKWVLHMKDTQGNFEGMFYNSCKEMTSELIRLRDGHNWTVIEAGKKLGVLDHPYFYPYPKQENKQ